MKKSNIWFGVIVVIIFAVIGSVVAFIFSRFIDFGSSKSIGISAPVTKPIGVFSYNPPTLQDAPADIKNVVMLGYNIMTDTRIFTQQCAVCHGNDGQSTLRAPPLWRDAQAGKPRGLCLSKYAEDQSLPHCRTGSDVENM